MRKLDQLYPLHFDRRNGWAGETGGPRYGIGVYWTANELFAVQRIKGGWVVHPAPQLRQYGNAWDAVLQTGVCQTGQQPTTFPTRRAALAAIEAVVHASTN